MNTSNEALDFLDISQLIANERYWRDTYQWEKMRNAFHPESMVYVSWFKGSGFAFVYFEALLSRYGVTKKERPPAQPRFGSILERLFGTTNTMLLNQLRGTTQATKVPRQMDLFGQSETPSCLDAPTVLRAV